MPRIRGYEADAINSGDYGDNDPMDFCIRCWDKNDFDALDPDEESSVEHVNDIMNTDYVEIHTEGREGYNDHPPYEEDKDLMPYHCELCKKLLGERDN